MESLSTHRQGMEEHEYKLTLEEIQWKIWELICAFYRTVWLFSYPPERSLIINNYLSALIVNFVLNMYMYFVSYITMIGDCQRN